MRVNASCTTSSASSFERRMERAFRRRASSYRSTRTANASGSLFESRRTSSSEEVARVPLEKRVTSCIIPESPIGGTFYNYPVQGSGFSPLTAPAHYQSILMSVLAYNDIVPKTVIEYDREPYEVLSSHVFRMQMSMPVNQTKL